MLPRVPKDGALLQTSTDEQLMSVEHLRVGNGMPTAKLGSKSLGCMGLLHLLTVGAQNVDVLESYMLRSYALGSARLGELRRPDSYIKAVWDSSWRIGCLRDSTHLGRRLKRPAARLARHQLLARLQADGYLYLRTALRNNVARQLKCAACSIQELPAAERCQRSATLRAAPSSAPGFAGGWMSYWAGAFRPCGGTTVPSCHLKPSAWIMHQTQMCNIWSTLSSKPFAASMHAKYTEPLRGLTLKE